MEMLVAYWMHEGLIEIKHDYKQLENIYYHTHNNSELKHAPPGLDTSYGYTSSRHHAPIHQHNFA